MINGTLKRLHSDWSAAQRLECERLLCAEIVAGRFIAVLQPAGACPQYGFDARKQPIRIRLVGRDGVEAAARPMRVHACSILGPGVTKYAPRFLRIIDP
jgi:hypothetical protein